MKFKKIFILTVLSAFCLSGCSKKDYNAEDYVKLDKYKGIETANISTEVTQEDIDAELEKLISAHTVYDDVQRPIQIYDILNIDLTASIDGEEISGFTVNGYDIYIGFSSYVMDGFAEQLIGLEPGKAHEFTMIVPDTFTEAEYIGKEVTFYVTLNSVRGQVSPELTDEFIKSATDSETLEEYLEELKAIAKENKEKNVNEQIKSNVWKSIVDNTVCETYPEKLLEETTEEVKSQFELYASVNGITIEEYIQANYNMSIEDYAKGQVKQELIFEVIAKKEKIKISDSEYQKNLPSFAEKMNESDEKAFEHKYGEKLIKQRMLWDKIQQFLADNAIIK